MRLKDKVAIVVGAGQSPGEGMGNGRATALRFTQEGAKVMAVDRDLRSAEETASMVKQSGGECVAFEADVTKERTLIAAIAAAGKSGSIQRYSALIAVLTGVMIVLLVGITLNDSLAGYGLAVPVLIVSATMSGSLGCIGGLPLAARKISILGYGSRLKPSTRARSTGLSRRKSSASDGSGFPRNSRISATRLAEATRTSSAPAARCS